MGCVIYYEVVSTEYQHIIQPDGVLGGEVVIHPQRHGRREKIDRYFGRIIGLHQIPVSARKMRPRHLLLEQYLSHDVNYLVLRHADGGTVHVECKNVDLSIIQREFCQMLRLRH